MFYRPVYLLPVVAVLGKTHARRWGIRIGGTLLLIVFVLRLNIDLGHVAEQLGRANMWYVAAAVLLIFPILAIKAWRWQGMLVEQGITLGYHAAFHLYALGIAAGSFTPGQSGDAIKALYLRDMGYSTGAALLAVILDRLYDTVLLLILAGVSLLAFGTLFISVVPTLLALSIGIGLLLAVLFIPAWHKFVTTRVQRFLRPKTDDTTTDTRPVHPQVIVRAAILTGVTTVLAISRVWLLAAALGLPLAPVEAVAASSLATVASLLPVSIGGIGARDAALVVVLGSLGYSRDSAIDLSTLVLLLNVGNLVVGYGLWWVRRSL